jgi:hypothetical protein
MSEMKAEPNLYNGANISIERGGDINESFEVHMSLSNPAGSSCDTESESKDVEDKDSVVPVETAMPPIFQLVKNKKWAVVYASMAEDKELATIQIMGSSPISGGELLLHYVCKSNGPAPIVACVLKANPEAVSALGCGGYLPLHYACDAGAPVAVVELLLEAYPGSVKVPDTENSRLPLHLAARKEDSATAEVIALLMSYYPEAAISRDANGKRPIDYAAKAKNMSKKARWENVAVLEMGEKWINVGQNVTLRLEEDFAERLRSLEKDFGSYVDSLKAVHDEEIAKIANDLLDAEFDPELMAEELKSEKEEMKEVDAKLQAKLDAIVKRHDRFLIVQEESRMQRQNLQVNVKSTQKPLADDQVRETKVDGAMESISQLIQELQQEFAEKTIITSTEPATEKERELTTRVAVLEKGERLKAGVIKRITAMAKMQEEKSKTHIVELVDLIDEQQNQVNSLLVALDLCEEQIKVLKDRVETSKVDSLPGDAALTT